MHRIGIDIGGTQLRVALLDDDYNIVDLLKAPNDRAKDAAQNVEPLVGFVNKCLQDGATIAGIGIGSPGPLDLVAGKMLNPPNLVGWDGFEIVDHVAQATGLPTYLNNDANVAGLGEAIFGGGKGYESVIFIGISTGFGGAYVFRNELVNGAHGNAAEYWNMIVNDDPYHHKNANAGSLNEQASGSGLQRIATERYGTLTTPKELFERYYAGDELAADIIERATEVFARGIANIMCTFDPEVIVIGGSVAINNPVYVEKAAKKARAYMIAPDSLNLKKAQFGDDAGLIGAALLVP